MQVATKQKWVKHIHKTLLSCCAYHEKNIGGIFEKASKMGKMDEKTKKILARSWALKHDKATQIVKDLNQHENIDMVLHNCYKQSQFIRRIDKLQKIVLSNIVYSERNELLEGERLNKGGFLIDGEEEALKKIHNQYYKIGQDAIRNLKVLIQ